MLSFCCLAQYALCITDYHPVDLKKKSPKASTDLLDGQKMTWLHSSCEKCDLVFLQLLLRPFFIEIYTWRVRRKFEELSVFRSSSTRREADLSEQWSDVCPEWCLNPLPLPVPLSVPVPVDMASTVRHTTSFCKADRSCDSIVVQIEADQGLANIYVIFSLQVKLM